MKEEQNKLIKAAISQFRSPVEYDINDFLSYYYTKTKDKVEKDLA